MHMMPLGNLIYVKILNQEVIIVNSYDDAEALLDKRSRIYSDRPYLATTVPWVLLSFLYSITLIHIQFWVVIPLCTYELW